MTETREQIRMKLWADVFGNQSKFGNDFAAACANNALKAFDENFPEKETVNEVTVLCFSCGKQYPASEMVPVAHAYDCKDAEGYACKECLGEKYAGKWALFNEKFMEKQITPETSTLFAVGQRVCHKRSGATGTVRGIASKCFQVDWDDRPPYHCNYWYAHELEELP